MAQPRNRIFVLSDLVLLPFAVLISFALRLDGFDFFGYERSFLVFTALAALIPPFVFLLLGVYARYWRYASVEDVRLLGVAVAVAVALISAGTVVGLRFFPTGLTGLLTLRFTTGTPVLPRSIPFIFFLLALPATALPRLAVRLLAGYAQGQSRAARTRAVVMGAGDAGVVIVRELKRNARSSLEIVGFLDDDPRKRAMRIHGLPVVGSHYDIPRVVEEYALDQVIIAIPSAPGKTIRAIVEICEGAGVRTKIMPGIHELLDGSVSINQLRDVQIEDLLRREPIQTDIAAVTGLVRGKRVLVTGGGGSIGSELCRQLLRCGPAKLVVVGHGENSVFHIVNELQTLAGSPMAAEQREGDRRAAPPTTIAAVIADIRFADRIRAVFAEHRPEIVFHAAAHKHVTLMELNPAEAITNNVLGTKNLVEAAVAAGVRQFVMISTDKAVNPTNIMGASKRAAELLVHRAARQSGRAFVAVRFGNVLGSRGSVVPIFKAQIAAGGPVTVTHPEVVRYFITIPEAVQLVLQAATLGQGGEVFVLDMGEPVKIVDLAKDLIELSGLEVGRDIDIVFKGLQPGEKLYEEMFVPGEAYARTQHRQILLAANAGRFVPLRLEEAVAALAESAGRYDTDAIVDGLRQLVPEFQPAREPVAVEQHRAEGV